VKIAVVGSRSWTRTDIIEEYLESIFRGGDTLVSGGAAGADGYAENWARHYTQRDVKVDIRRPDWRRHGKGAGLIRNQEIVDNADMVIAFWDGKSRGTNDTIEKAGRRGLYVIVVNAEGEVDHTINEDRRTWHTS
jgi:hypothetical protein